MNTVGVQTARPVSIATSILTAPKTTSVPTLRASPQRALQIEKARPPNPEGRHKQRFVTPRFGAHVSILAGSGALVLILHAAVALALPCGDADGSGTLSAPDALAVLRSAVGSSGACNPCECDPDCNRDITARDALLVLQIVIGTRDGGCCTIDECFTNDDCGEKEECASPNECDQVCEPLATP